MSELFKADNINLYNEWAGVDTQNPLVGFIDFSNVKPLRHARKIYGFYAVFLKDQKCGELRYGRRYYDYQNGTLIFIASGQVFGAEDDGMEFQPDGYLLMFHPDLLRNTPLGRMMREYSFFSYETNEALHLSTEERQIIMDCFRKIQYELNHPIDRTARTSSQTASRLFLTTAPAFMTASLSRAAIRIATSSQDSSNCLMTISKMEQLNA